MAQEQVVALSGGVGGAKLAVGLKAALPAGGLSLIANTGDDFDHLGLRISPDIDTLAYSLAGVANAELGWGRAGESWRAMTALEALGGPGWFRLGDLDLGTHLARADLLRQGLRLTEVTRRLAAALGAGAAILPMTDETVATRVLTDRGEMAFQPWFVGERAAPAVRGLRYEGADRARPTPEVLAALADPDLAAIVLCPSNPWLSIAPILAVPGLADAIRASGRPVVAVSPLIGGRSIKGPTDKILQDLGLPPGFAAIAAAYDDLVDGYVVDDSDLDTVRGQTRRAVLSTDTLMLTDADKRRVAEAALTLARRLRHG